MDEETIDINLAKEVGALSYRALMMAKSMVKPGARLLDVADAVEKFTRDEGYECAFPLNLSVNHEAAHYTPAVQDEKVFSETDVVKVDFGAAKNGVLGDCAVTVDLSGEKPDLAEAVAEALNNAVSTIKDGVMVSEIGRVIGDTITARGFKPIANLGGHLVAKHDLHSHIFVPNYDNHDETVLEEGMTVAIEPFATDGKKNIVLESDVCEIYNFSAPASVRSMDSRSVLEMIMKKYASEPFAVRWLTAAASSKFGLYAAIRELLRGDVIFAYPMLVGQPGSTITQAEVEVLVEKDSCTVLTK